jgi:hypothetical protein
MVFFPLYSISKELNEIQSLNKDDKLNLKSLRGLNFDFYRTNDYII